ncbi:MAG: hypothetical protein KGI54_18320, partial [Pseudomonadota bacterium]|nr:hypothetical protein [Pseudomonadota bacterium]
MFILQLKREIKNPTREPGKAALSQKRDLTRSCGFPFLALTREYVRPRKLKEHQPGARDAVFTPLAY